MAGTDGKQTSPLKEQLLSAGHRYSFVQAYRLLRLLVPEAPFTDALGKNERITTRPHLSPDSPDAEVISIAEDIASGQERYTITAPFPGLYGVSSPLPPFYTEDLPGEASAGGTVALDSLECVAEPLYRLFFESWAKHRLLYGIIEKGEDEGLDRLLSLIGVSRASLKGRLGNPLSLLACLGPATQMPRSAEGLRAFLAGILAEATVRIEECVPQMITIPEDQLFSLGVKNHCLGETAHCGSRMEDRVGQFGVGVGPVGDERFLAFLPDMALFKELQEGIRVYLDQPLDWYLQISVKPSEIRAACLGTAGASTLGWNTWLSSETPPGECAVRLTP